MSETPNIGAPLLAAGQAQKHVTVNEALSRLDALVQSTAISRGASQPPLIPEEGHRYIVAPGAGGEWTGRDGQIAFFSNGGWDFAEPGDGWRVWVRDEAVEVVWAGNAWRAGQIGPAAGGAHIGVDTITAEESFPAGAGFATDLSIPDRAIILGVTARVTTPITGTGLTGWRVGVDGFADRYGTGIGVSVDSSLVGVSGAPLAYYGATPLRVEPEGGEFAGGAAVFAIHLLKLTPPDIG